MIISLLNNKSIWKFLLLVSYSPGAGYTRNELKKLLSWNNVSLDRTIEKLLFYKIISKESRIIKLNFNNSQTNKVLELIESEKQRLNQPNFELFYILTEILNNLEKNDISALYLFGSHAKKTASSNSDIDIAVITDKKINLIETKGYILEKFNKNIQFHFFSKKEFYQKQGNLINNIIKDGVKLI